MDATQIPNEKELETVIALTEKSSLLSFVTRFTPESATTWTIRRILSLKRCSGAGICFAASFLM